MNHIEKFSDRDLIEMQEICKVVNVCASPIKDPRGLKDICKIALVEINRELDTRKIKKGI